MAIADADGVAALSMRSLAKSLGFEVMSLYNHVANKPELLTLMVDAVAAEIEEPAAEPGSVKGARARAMSMRAALVRHPWACELWHRDLPGPAQTVHMEGLLRTLGESGLSSDLAHHGFHAVNNHVLGYSLQEIGIRFDSDGEERAMATAHTFLEGLSEDEHSLTIAHVHQHLAGETGSSFELVLDLILDGLVRLNEAGA